MLFLPNFSENLEGDWEAKRASSELMMPELACGLFEALPVIVSWSSWEPGSRPPPPSPRAWGGGLGNKQRTADWLLLHPTGDGENA